MVDPRSTPVRDGVCAGAVGKGDAAHRCDAPAVMRVTLQDGLPHDFCLKCGTRWLPAPVDWLLTPYAIPSPQGHPANAS